MTASKSLLLLLAPTALFACHPAYSQDSFTSSLALSSDTSLADSNTVDGFNSSFDPSTADFSTGELHSGVNDATNSLLLGSNLSSTVNSFVQVTPLTSTLTDAQSAGSPNGSFGGRQGSLFAPGGTSGLAAGRTSREVALSTLGTESLRGAFTGLLSSQAAFSGASAANTAAAPGFSGEGVVVPPTLNGAGASGTLATLGGASSAELESQSVYLATDPVLTGSTAGFIGGSSIHGDLPTPSTQTASFFASQDFSPAQYQYDDGQTPAASSTALAGPVLGGAPSYGPATNGFPDSTKGLAGLPTEASNLTSPLSAPRNEGGSPFAPVSEGTVFGLKGGFSPDLHTPTATFSSLSFENFERRALQRRLASGVTISQATELRAKDLREFQQRGERRRRSLPGQVSNFGTQSLLPTPHIR